MISIADNFDTNKYDFVCGMYFYDFEFATKFHHFLDAKLFPIAALNLNTKIINFECLKLHFRIRSD